MKFLNELTELVQQGLINQETADKIAHYYTHKNQNSSQKLLMVFGILGAVLIGLGLILIVAHNWDSLSNGQKTFFAVIPLLLSQLGAGYTMLYHSEKVMWKEIVAVFICFSVAAALSLIAQIYQIPGSIPSFVLTWMLLILPLVYLLPSQMLSLFYIIGITYYASYVTFWDYPRQENYWYWLLLAAVIPNYWGLITSKKETNFLNFHHWLIVASVSISLGTLSDTHVKWMFVGYASLFAIYYFMGNTPYFNSKSILKNPYKIVGFLGSIIVLLIVSFDWFWKEFDGFKNQLSFYNSQDFVVATVLTIVGLGLLVKNVQAKKVFPKNPIDYAFVIFFLIYLLGNRYEFVQVLINLLILAIAIYHIVTGAKSERLGVMNLGLLTITALIIFRFFDSNISFIVRGILFLMIGFGFFGLNYWLIKKKKNEEQ